MSERFLERWRDDLRVTVAALAADDQIAVEQMRRPVPPAEHIRRVNSAEKAVPPVFLRSGTSDLLAIVETLADAGALLRERPTIMELGCGVGRLLRHAPDPALAQMIATDVNAESLAWCRTHLPGVAYHHHESLPPIASLPAASVDVIYAHSVFTHIPLERQLAWLREAERLLRPGGWLAATFLGREQQDAILDATQRAALAADGAIQIFPEWAPSNDGDGPRDHDRQHAVAYGAVCQTIAHQEASVGSLFEIALRRERPGRQDVLAVRRR